MLYLVCFFFFAQAAAEVPQAPQLFLFFSFFCVGPRGRGSAPVVRVGHEKEGKRPHPSPHRPQPSPHRVVKGQQRSTQMGRQKRALVLLSQIALCHATLCCSCGVRVLVAGSTLWPCLWLGWNVAPPMNVHDQDPTHHVTYCCALRLAFLPSPARFLSRVA